MVHFVPIQRHDPAAKGDRGTYASWLLAEQNLNFLSVDEFGLQIAT
jgi:hypothetical protein